MGGRGATTPEKVCIHQQEALPFEVRAARPGCCDPENFRREFPQTLRNNLKKYRDWISEAWGALVDFSHEGMRALILCEVKKTLKGMHYDLGFKNRLL